MLSINYRLPINYFACCALIAAATTKVQAAPPDGVQPPASDAVRQVYEARVARCNNGSLPDPQKEACLRDAGGALDAARGGPPRNVEKTSANGRATVVLPAGQAAPDLSGNTRPTANGRADVVPPAAGGRIP